MNFTPKSSVSHCVSILYDCLFLGPPRSPDCYSALLPFHVIGEDRVNIAEDLPYRLQVSEFKTRFPHLDEELTASSYFLSADLGQTAELLLRSFLSKSAIQLTSRSSNCVNILWIFLRNPPFHRPYIIFRLLLLIVTLRDHLLLQYAYWYRL